METLNRILDITELEPYNSVKQAYDVQSNIRMQLYTFFKTHEQGIFYTFEYPSSKELLKYINSEHLDIYHLYGLYFEDGARNAIHNYLMPIPSDVFRGMADDPQVFSRHVDSFCKKYGITEDEITFSVIECSKQEQSDYINRLLAAGRNVDVYRKCYKEYKIDNPGFNFDVIVAGSKYEQCPAFRGCTFVNFAKFLVESGCMRAVGYSHTIYLQLELLRKLEAMDPDTVVFYCNPDDIAIPYQQKVSIYGPYHETVYRLYVVFAAYLTVKHNFRFDMPDRLFQRYVTSVRDLSARQKRYLDRYLEYVDNPIPVSVIQEDGQPAFLCQQKKASTDFVQLTMQYFEVEDGECIPDSYTMERLMLKDIELLHVTDLYRLHTLDYEEGRAEMMRLQALLDKVQAELCRKKLVVMESLDCSNTILFRKDGKLYVGYVSEVNAKKHYSTRIILPGYEYQEDKDFSARELSAMMDIRCFPDYRMLFKQDITPLFHAPDETSDGFLSILAEHHQEAATEACGLAYDSIGMWHKCSRLLRGRRVSKLLNCKIPVTGIRRNFLSFFGGPHPYRGKDNVLGKPTLNLDYELWRDTDVY